MSAIDTEALVEAPFKKGSPRGPPARACSRDRRRSRSRDRRRSRSRDRPRHDDPTRRRYDDRRDYRRREPSRPPSPPPTEDERDRRTVFVQQLAARLRTKELIAFFDKAGPVRDAQIVKDRVSGRSKGYVCADAPPLTASVGYVEFRHEDSVKKAINMTGQRLLGIPVIAQLTEAEKNRQARLELLGKSAGDAPFHRLYIGNIHFSLTEDDLKTVFEAFGELESVCLQTEPDTTRSRGHGYVQFKDPSSAREALEKLNGTELAGRPIRVGLGGDKFTNESTSAQLARFEDRDHDTPADRARDDYDDRRDSARHTGSKDKSNLDDSETGGVSFQNISREALMKKLAREPAPTSQAAGPMAVHRANKDTKPKIETTVASRCILLKNMFDPLEETSDSLRELEDDVRAECTEKYGKVVHIHVDEGGEIYVKFEKISSGENAILGLNGRWFGGRQVAASPLLDAIYSARFPRTKAL
ncbi:RNA-binding protein rsd1 [Neolecta irregularis DAH-3]|uniref:RNA-binding protein rsd1 n=1 Tax=Neolecta irregularis (strain DAH-3) TaxID=1198029 RepID=A0A1U7LVM9_NEOID|nr:RNA-binding protein rsd1 [Neolecta irregularis DAH-3]|eukprot:OLL26571.1 RNA-binding protein rsd1 [Neolecta irregularis DAH-3]